MARGQEAERSNGMQYVSNIGVKRTSLAQPCDSPSADSRAEELQDLEATSKSTLNSDLDLKISGSLRPRRLCLTDTPALPGHNRCFKHLKLGDLNNSACSLWDLAGACHAQRGARCLWLILRFLVSSPPLTSADAGSWSSGFGRSL